MINSKKLLAISFLISILIFASVGRAAEQLLATISTDSDTGSCQLVVSATDHDQIITRFLINSFENGSLYNQDELPMKIFLKEGIKFNGKGGHIFAQINIRNFDEEQGGVIIIDTLYNALTGKRKSYELELAKDQTEWKLFFEGRPISTIVAIAHKIAIIGIVGAKDLIMK